LVERHGPRVLGVCRRILRSSHEADDAFQATFLVLVRKAGSLCRQDLLGPWLYGVAVRTALKARTRAWRRRALERPLTNREQAQAAGEVGGADFRQILDEELTRLSPRYQKPILLCYVEGKTTAEAGEILGCPKGTVLSRLSRAREKLRARFLRRGLALSATAVVTLLSETAGAAAVPPGLVQATAEAASSFALGKAASAGAVSAPVAALTKGVLTSMLLAKLKTATILLALTAALVTGVWASYPGMGQAGAVRRTPNPGAVPAGFAPAGDQTELQALLDKAIKAAGGARLGKFNGGTCKIKGNITIGDAKAPFTFDAFLHGADQVKVEGEFEQNGMKTSMAIVMNGDQCWAKFGDKIEDAPKETARGIRDVIRTFRYVHALTPLKDKNLTLALVGEVDVDGKPAVGLKVGCKDERDIDLFLDKATGQPLKAEWKFTNRNGQDEALEFTFTGHKELDGRKHFTKVALKIDGKAMFDAEFSDFRWTEKLEPSVFERP